MKHPLVLNLKATKKIQKGENEKKKITKIAIGVEGGIPMDKIEWDIKSQLKCLACSKDLPESKFTDKIQKQILTATTS